MPHSKSANYPNKRYNYGNSRKNEEQGIEVVSEKCIVKSPYNEPRPYSIYRVPVQSSSKGEGETEGDNNFIV